MLKKKKKKKIIIILVICLILVLLILGYIYFTMRNIYLSNEYQLKKLGYSEKEITQLTNNEDYLNYALNNSYDELFIKFINTEGFDFTLFEKYLDYYKVNDSAPISDVIYLINNDIDYAYSSELMDFIKGKYFLKTRIERYLNYQKLDPTLTIDEIIKRVNSNVDSAFYTNIVDTDTSVGNLLICNKYYKLSSTYTGNLVYMSSTYSRRGGQMLDSTAYEAFVKLSDAARSQGLNIVNQSAYRSYSNQSSIYNSYLSQNGQAWTDKWSARPGHSEHQTGLALDVATYTTVQLGDFEYTNEFVWMQQHAHEYGFILRYPDGQEYITGYGYEPWHYRYVGVEAATQIYNEKITYEEYYTYYILKK